MWWMREATGPRSRGKDTTLLTVTASGTRALAVADRQGRLREMAQPGRS